MLLQVCADCKRSKKKARGENPDTGLASLRLRRLVVLVTSFAMAGNAVGCRILSHGLVHLSNHRLGLVDLEVAEVVAAAAGDVIDRLHPVGYVFSHDGTMLNLLFGSVKRAGDLADERVGAAYSLVPEQTDDLSLADGVHRFILEVAVNALSLKAGMRGSVLTLLVGSIGSIH